MKALSLLLVLLLPLSTFAQKHRPLPHGYVFGDKPNTIGMMDASKIDAFMGKRTRTNATLMGRIVKITKQKGGWFDLDAGNGKIIAAHFTNYNITLPANLAGRTVIIEGVVQKQFIADDLQHFAGDTVYGKKQHTTNVDPKKRLSFEVKGLFVD